MTHTCGLCGKEISGQQLDTVKRTLAAFTTNHWREALNFLNLDKAPDVMCAECTAILISEINKKLVQPQQ